MAGFPLPGGQSDPTAADSPPRYVNGRQLLEKELEARPLTHSQQQIWIGQSLNPNSPLYNMAFAVLFAAELEPDRFCRAWRRVVDQSDALRTVVWPQEGRGAYVVRDAGCCSTEVLDFKHHEDPESAFRRWCEERCFSPLATDGDLVDSVLVQLGNGRTGWYLNQHHLITDAFSTVLVYRRLAAEYAALGGDGEREPPLAPYYPTVAALTAPAAARSAAREYWAERRGSNRPVVTFYGRSGEAKGTRSSRVTLQLDGARSRAIDASRP